MAKKISVIREHWREAYSPLVFTNNLQIWLALLAFALFIVTLLWDYVWGWWEMLEELSPLAWVAYILGSLTVIFFGVMALWSFISFLVVIWRGWFGINVPDNLPQTKSKRKHE